MKVLNGKGKTKSLVSIMLIFMLLLGSFTSFAIEDSSIIEMGSAREDLKEIADAKIQSEVKKELEDNDYVEVLVRLKDRVNLEEVIRLKSVGKTSYQQKLSGRRALVNALVDNAETSQRRLIKSLEQEQLKSNKVEFEPFYIVNMVYVKGDKNLIEKISYMDEVDEIYLNKKIQLDNLNEDNSKANTSSNEGLEWNIDRIQADKAWALGYDGTGVVVGIIDTGGEWTHPALQEKWRGYNPQDPNNPINIEENWFDAIGNRELPYDDNDHATHCLGTILGQEPDGSNKIGVAPGAKWIAAKAFSASGGSSGDSLIRSGQWMLAPGGNPDAAPDVINNSWGGGDGIDDWYRDVVRAWRAAGIVPVFAAGNQGFMEPAPWPGSIECPSNYPESFAVAATDIKNKRASFSKLGPSPYNGELIKPEISAPGVDIRSSVPGGKYGLMDGTSMATPHIAGVIALMLSANQSLEIDEITDIIQDTATPLTDETYKVSPNFGYGYGLANAFEAVSFVGEGVGNISGKVLIPGEDKEQPNLGHEQLITKAYMDNDIEIIAEASDDISIVEAEVLVKFEGENEFQSIKMNRASGNHRNGIYKGYIPKDILKEGELSYKIKATDFANNVVETDENIIDIKFGIVPDEYYEDFETEPMGWEFSGDWEWGPYGKGYGEPRPYSGDKYVGTVIGGYYQENNASVLITPPIDLRDSTLEAATLKYKQWYKMASWSTFASIYISTDGGDNWEQIGERFTGNGDKWAETSVNLKEYIGSEKPVYVAFLMESGLWGSELGWYIDDIKLEGLDITAPEAPSKLIATPSIEGIKLDWNSSIDGDVDIYNIYRSEKSGEDYIKIASTKELTYTDEDVEVGNTYYYVISATDFSKNESKYSNEVSETPLVFEEIYYSNFEEDNGGLTTGGENNSWEWGEPTYGPEGAFTGTNTWATNLSGDYKNNSNSWIKLEDIQLPNEGNLVLNIWHWFDTEGIKWDYGQIQISTDNENWTNIDGAKFGDHIKEWMKSEISLNEYKGQKVNIRFLFVSDSMNFGSNTFMGWYIDSIGIYNIENEDYTVPENIIKNEEVQTKEELFVPSESLDYIMNKTVGINAKFSTNKSVNSIPADAVVTVLETGRSVRTDLATGDFFMRHTANEEGQYWTLRAEAYGYYPKEEKVRLEEGQTVSEIFELEPIPTTSISGRVYDRHTKKPVANAIVRLKEDSNIPSVVTDENGNFTVPKVYEGKYTLKINHDDFEPGEISIDAVIGKENEFEVSLKRFVGYPEEIIYDDGTAENALSFNYKDYGFAIRITPSEYGKVKGARVYFWDKSYPIPGGNETSITIIDTDSKGDPAEMIGEPKVITVERGAWNYIDLTEFNFSTDRDFFIALIQTDIGDYSPGIGVDSDSKESDRSHIFGKGQFMKLKEADIEGGFMIRTTMEYSMDSPRITNLQEVNYTNQFSTNIRGKSIADCKIKVYVNEDEPIIVNTRDKEFSADINLKQDVNTVYITAILGGKETEPSDMITIIKDQIPPELELSYPEDKLNTSNRVIDIVGNVKDMYLDKVIVNEELALVDENGNFAKPIILNDGENIITISAYDLAGNKTTAKRRVYLNNETPVITDIKPDTDLFVEIGDEVEISFRSEITGGDAKYRIVLPYSIESNRLGIPMEEIEPGYYRAIWVVPEGLSLRDEIVEIQLTDSYGNTSYETAKGRINTGRETDIEEPMENLLSNTVIVGDEAFDIRYLNNNEESQLKLIEWYSQGKEIYIKLSANLIVNIRGEEVDIEELPNELTYYDMDGRTKIYKK